VPNLGALMCEKLDTNIAPGVMWQRASRSRWAVEWGHWGIDGDGDLVAQRRWAVQVGGGDPKQVHVCTKNRNVDKT